MMINFNLHLPRSRRSRRRGSILVITALMTIVLFAMVAFAVDIGYILHIRTELQCAADACALAAVRHLPDEHAAWHVAYATAAQNASGEFEILDGSDVEFGYWDRDSASFTAPAPFGQDSNAVRVTVRRTQAAETPVALFIAPLIGTSSADVTATSTAMFDQGLCGPLIGIDLVNVPGTATTDSYSTDEGFYDPEALNGRGGICSDGPVRVEGTADIKGDARAGKGFNVTIEGNATVTGSIGSRLRPLQLPPVDASNAAADNDNAQLPLIRKGKSWKSPVDGAGNFLLEGTRTYNIPTGTYYFKNFTVKGQSVFNVDGRTIIYITGNLERSGGATVNNNTQIPANLQIYMTGGTANVTSNNEFHGAIYAPNTDIRLDGSSDLFGVFVGKTLTMTGGSAAHYDEALVLDEVELPKRTFLVD